MERSDADEESPRGADRPTGRDTLWRGFLAEPVPSECEGLGMTEGGIPRGGDFSALARLGIPRNPLGKEKRKRIFLRYSFPAAFLRRFASA
ncbi:MAG: hypothetical protein D6679_10390 [Candidatus Hydrogenedentota bacterium]|nr:MAG: hypothetical protein D6679_10390 [Candidatus Hydrogenedentota bacterium]